jgi:hypothetical protein
VLLGNLPVRFKIFTGLVPFLMGLLVMLALRAMGALPDMPSAVFVFSLTATVAAGLMVPMWRQAASQHTRRIARPDDLMALLAMCMRRQQQVLWAYAGITCCVVVAYLLARALAGAQ